MKKIILVMALMASTLVMGAELKKHMIITSTSGAANFNNSDSSNYELDTISISSGYYYAINKYIQLGAQGSYTIHSSMDDTSYTITPGAILNVPLNEKDGIEDSIFFGINGGYMGTTGEVMKISEFFYTAELGKRFKILENLSYSPSLSMLHIPAYDANTDPSFSLNFLKLSIHF